MKYTFYIEGTLLANPENITNKHISQSTWKRVCYIDFGASDICRYYAWFMKDKYNLDLMKPLRNPHVTLVNDRLENIKGDNIECKEELWNEFCDKFNGIKCNIELDVRIRGNSQHYWLNVTEDSRNDLMRYRRFLGLNEPFSGMHMTIGRVKETDLRYSEYVLSLLKLCQKAI